MRNAFLRYIEKECLISPGQRVLLGISGGVDSMVMAELFSAAGIPHAYAHCNYMLRGDESMRDEAFVCRYAEDKGVEVFVKRFDTGLYAARNNISIQMAARQLRFEWFEEILAQSDYDLVSTAHHKDDQIETFFLNLMRSTGIAGLHGILPRRDKLIHPLLFAFREDILEFARRNNIAFCEDSSNKSLKYARNKIRKQIIPLLEELHPNYKQILTSNIKRIRETEQIYREAVERVIEELETTKDNFPAINIEKLKATRSPSTYLFEYLSRYYFKYATVEDIIDSLQGSPGKVFHSPTHRVYLEREYLVIKKQEEEQEPQFLYLEESDIPGYIDKPLRLSFSWLENTPDFSITSSPNTALIDADQLEWPLHLGVWKTGEHFYPLGMEQAKKISDFLIDEKIPVYEKHNTFVLRSGRRVIWIVGKRLDHRFRITDHTRNILKIKRLID
ncbi:MAG: tRNA lysidine(34) synthetase TilS [Bacteroidales bacterium]